MCCGIRPHYTLVTCVVVNNTIYTLVTCVVVNNTIYTLVTCVVVNNTIYTLVTCVVVFMSYYTLVTCVVVSHCIIYSIQVEWHIGDLNVRRVNCDKVCRLIEEMECAVSLQYVDI